MTQLSLPSNVIPIPPPASPIHHSSPPPYEHEVVHHDTRFGEDKALLAPVSPTSTLKAEGEEYEKVVPSCAEGHDTGLSPRCKAIVIGAAVINPCYGLAFMLCPQARRRVCKRCGERVMVPIKRAFC